MNGARVEIEAAMLEENPMRTLLDPDSPALITSSTRTISKVDRLLVNLQMKDDQHMHLPHARRILLVDQVAIVI